MKSYIGRIKIWFYFFFQLRFIYSIDQKSNGWLSVQCLPVCHLVLGDSWSNVWPTWTSESGWLGGVLQFVDFQRKIMGWFELLLLIELEYNNIVVSSILTLQHSLVSAGWSVSVYLANFLVTYALTNCYNIVLNQWFGHCSLSLFLHISHLAFPPGISGILRHIRMIFCFRVTLHEIEVWPLSISM